MAILFSLINIPSNVIEFHNNKFYLSIFVEHNKRVCTNIEFYCGKFAI